MLKRLFTSNTRIKLLSVYLMDDQKEYFIRELTRLLDEQINSVRRELDNLKKMGFLKTRTVKRKKYYFVNQDFIFLEELRSIFFKSGYTNKKITAEIQKMGDVQLLALAGQFVQQPTNSVDMLIVGEVNREKLTHYINNEIRTNKPIKFTVMDVEDYKYRISCHDRFLKDLIESPENQIPVKKI